MALVVGAVWIALLCVAYRYLVQPRGPAGGIPVPVAQGSD
jgi:histidine transporter